ncbi:MAG: TIR domain-containing protein [Crocosphaera sp.]
MTLNRPSPFSAYFGLDEIVVIPKNFEKALEQRIEKLKKNEFKLNTYNGFEEEYFIVRLCDTFFSDTFPLLKLIDLVELTEKYPKLEIRFILLDPFSTIAPVRANALEADQELGVFVRLNRGLKKILDSLNGSEGYDHFFEQYRTKPFCTKYLLEAIQERINTLEIRLEIKFTKEYTDLPFYMIGFYVFKGMIFPDSSAAQNPWSIYVDDPLEDRDTFSTLQKWFDKLWDCSLTIDNLQTKIDSVLDKDRSIFLSHGRQYSELVRNIKSVVENTRYLPEWELNYIAQSFEQEFKDGQTLTIPDVWKNRVRECHIAIVLFLAEDDSEEAVRASQNVIHELGYLQALLGRKRVFIIIEEGLNFPQSIEYTTNQFATIHRTSNGFQIGNICDKIVEFLSRRR